MKTGKCLTTVGEIIYKVVCRIGKKSTFQILLMILLIMVNDLVKCASLRFVCRKCAPSNLVETKIDHPYYTQSRNLTIGKSHWWNIWVSLQSSNIGALFIAYSWNASSFLLISFWTRPIILSLVMLLLRVLLYLFSLTCDRSSLFDLFDELLSSSYIWDFLALVKWEQRRSSSFVSRPSTTWSKLTYLMFKSP